MRGVKDRIAVTAGVLIALFVGLSTGYITGIEHGQEQCEAWCQSQNRADRDYLLGSLRRIESILVRKSKEQGFYTITEVYARLVRCEERGGLVGE